MERWYFLHRSREMGLSPSRAETWQREGGPPFRLGGLHVRLMDGDALPWQVLPLDVRGKCRVLRRYEAT